MKTKTLLLLIPLLTTLLMGYVAYRFYAVTGTQKILLNNVYESHRDVVNALIIHQQDLVSAHLRLMDHMVSLHALGGNNLDQLRIDAEEINSIITNITAFQNNFSLPASDEHMLAKLSVSLENYQGQLSGDIAKGKTQLHGSIESINQIFIQSLAIFNTFLDGKNTRDFDQLLNNQILLDDELSRLGILLLILIIITVILNQMLSRSLSKHVTTLSLILNSLAERDSDINIPKSSYIIEFKQIFSSAMAFRDTLIKYQNSQHALNARSQELERLMATIPGMAYRCEFDDNWQMLMVSQGCLELTGYPPREIIDQQAQGFNHLIVEEDQKRILDEIKHACDSQRPYQLTYRIQTRNHSHKWVLDRGMEVYDEKTGDSVLEGLIIDITERKQAESEIHQLNTQLEQRVKARTADLQRSIDKLTSVQSQLIEVEKMASLGQIVAGVAREISTPIGICITTTSYLDLATEQMVKKLIDPSITRSEMNHYMSIMTEGLQLVEHNINITSDLINSFKLIAVDSSNEDRRDFYLHDYLNEIANTLQPQLKANNHQLIIDCPDNILLNSYPGAYYHIVTNLVENSILHGFAHLPDGRISMEIESSEDSLLLVYKDNGIGVDNDIRKRIFEPFFSAGSSHRSGLGMNIVFNAVTQRLKGQIHCSSEPGHGICFEIELPIKLESEAIHPIS